MPRTDALLIRGGHLIDPSQGLDAPGDILLAEGKVAWVGKPGEPPPQKPAQILPAKGLVVCPGFIDLHCHLREPGFEEKETIATGTLAAARGGFTTVCCMANTNPPLDNLASVEFVLRRAAELGAVRVLPVACVSQGRKGQELAEMAELAGAGAVAFSDDGDPVASTRLMRHALEYALPLGLPIMDHPQDVSLSQGGVMHEGWVATRLGLKGMPSAAEEVAVARDILLAELTGGWVHLQHLSTAGSVELVRLAKEKGLPITAEVTPHHLALTHELVLGKSPDFPGLHPYDTRTKVNPPLRSKEDVAALIQGLKDGIIDAIATDHAPHTRVDKECEYDLAASGISGLETALGLLLGLVHRGEIGLPDLIALLTSGPARILKAAGIPGLGTLQAGAPADVTVFDPDAEWTVEPEAFASKGRNTLLAGAVLRGKAMATIYGGKVVFQG
ncbi:MAG: dihydroorotase [Chloroflexi bacterium]|nr:dihydroorotase [Chloroflexota bacterium]